MQSKIDGQHEEQQVGATPSVRHWLCEPDLLLRNEYLAAENRILRTKLPTRLRLGDPERITLAEIEKRLGHKALREVACVANPTPFWLDIEGWSPRSSTALNTGSIPADLPFASVRP
jgi:hypothetical protein